MHHPNMDQRLGKLVRILEVVCSSASSSSSYNPLLADYPVKQPPIRNTTHATHEHTSSSLYQTSPPQTKHPNHDSKPLLSTYPLFPPTYPVKNPLPTLLYPTHSPYLPTHPNKPAQQSHIPIPKTSSIYPGFPNITYHKSPTPYLTSSQTAQAYLRLDVLI